MGDGLFVRRAGSANQSRPFVRTTHHPLTITGIPLASFHDVPNRERARMASVWKGSLTFGLVNIPVELKTAVRANTLSFRLLHAEDMSPVKYERVCATDGEVVPW